MKGTATRWPVKKMRINIENQLLASIPFAVSSLQDATQTIIELSGEGKPAHVHFANAYTIVLAEKDDEYAEILRKGALVFPDGKPLSWISALRGHRPRLRTVPGPDLFESVMEGGVPYGLRHYLLGSTEEVIIDLERSLTSRYPGLAIVGTYSPPFRELTAIERARQAADIKRSDAQIVWVGLGTPKQDFEVRKLAIETGRICVAVGAAFDFSSNHLGRAPRWTSALGFEWLFRLVKEPRRLWRRYIPGNLRFLRLVLSGRV